MTFCFTLSTADATFPSCSKTAQAICPASPGPGTTALIDQLLALLLLNTIDALKDTTTRAFSFSSTHRRSSYPDRYERVASGNRSRRPAGEGMAPGEHSPTGLICVASSSDCESDSARVVRDRRPAQEMADRGVRLLIKREATDRRGFPTGASISTPRIYLWGCSLARSLPLALPHRKEAEVPATGSRVTKQAAGTEAAETH